MAVGGICFCFDGNGCLLAIGLGLVVEIGEVIEIGLEAISTLNHDLGWGWKKFDIMLLGLKVHESEGLTVTGGLRFVG